VTKLLSITISLALLLLSSGKTLADEARTIGVLAFQGPAEALDRWTATATYLSDQIEGVTFSIQPHTLVSLRAAVENNQIDFVLTNPGQYVRLEHFFGVSRLLTLQINHGSHAHDEFGAVIFTRRDRTDIKNLTDLKGKRLGIVSTAAFGGFQMAYREIRQAGLDPFTDTRELRNFGFPQDAIVEAVRSGEIDAGTVRTGVLEKLIANGTIGVAELKVLNSRDFSPGFDLLHSTRLYPEWPLATLRSTPSELSKQVAQALLNLPPDHAAAVRARINGWTIPLSYERVHDLLRELQITPYEIRPLSFWDTLKVYRNELIFALIIMMTLIVTTGFIYRVNRRLRVSQLQIAEHRDTLERRVAERTEALSKANLALSNDIQQRQKIEARLERSRRALQDLYDISTAKDRGHQESLRQLLVLGRTYLDAQAGFLYDGSPLKAVIGDLSQSAIPKEKVHAEVESVALRWHDEASDLADLRTKSGTQILGITVNTAEESGGLILFYGIESSLEDEDREIMRLISEFIGSEIIQQAIEEESMEHQSQLSHVTRVSTLGEMTSGLAHEINQPLTQALNYVNGTLRRLRARPNNPSEIETGLNQAAASIGRATDIIQNLRRLLQTGTPEKHPFNLTPSIQNVARLCGAEVRQKRLTLNWALPEHPIWVTADRIQIEQVILNLLRNAIDAVPVEGIIRLVVQVDQHSVQLEIKDNGPGFQTDDLEQLFEPFYSTKNSGLGLGLSICRSITRAHNGSLRAGSSPEGASFILTLPLSMDNV